MAVLDAGPLKSKAVVADAFALYALATEHTDPAEEMRASVGRGRLTVTVSALAVATASGMRTCWDEYCSRNHRPDVATLVRRLCAGPGVEVVEMDLNASIAAGRLYASSSAVRVEGPEVLAGCHSALMAQELSCRVLTVARAAYCYTSPAVRELGCRLMLL
ncbi:hypothetical protein [Streptomyces pilosus]|uniref:Uncharacterized protein n=1 Tax=Streptomyces pilosus TaxID=28893 RepID=A0A918C3D9_9ACTN|nr:hypothetical protein [Streptomyces pilosus]GGR03658.1 hypothetical protein GCM10010280_59640 [Streptomyces pilosus]